MTEAEFLNLSDREKDAIVAEKPYRCRRCSSSEFFRYKKGYRGCIQCTKERRALWQARNFERAKECRREWVRKNKEKSLQYRKHWHLLNRYGISLDDYNKISDRQGGRCLICQMRPPKGKALCVDHCHLLGTVRGLLCDGCNIGLANFKENTDRMQKAIAYLNSKPAALKAVGAID